MTVSPDDRKRLAEQLRSLRKATGLSTAKLASQLGWSQSKISKSERGVTTPDPGDVAAWAKITGADSTVRDELIDLATQIAGEFTEWRRTLAPGRRRVQDEIQHLEANASVVRVFAPSLVVGLAQTWQYADTVFRLSQPPISAEERADAARARLDRQVALRDETKQFHFLMGEAAIRRRLIASSDMREQLDVLMRISCQDNVYVGVIPFDADERVHQYHGFAVLGDSECDEKAMVLASTVTRSINIRTSREIGEYINHFEALRAAALEGDVLREFLREVIRELRE